MIKTSLSPISNLALRTSQRERVRFLSGAVSWVGAVKTVVYLTMIVLLSAIYLADFGALATILVVLAMGIVFAHGLELQHEALHQSLFGSAVLNRVTGIIFGLPMLVSYTHYQSYHFHHHAAVGTGDDEEIINYSVESLRHPLRLILRAWNVMRLPNFVVDLIAMLRGRYPGRVKPSRHRRLFAEYMLMTGVLVAALSATLYWWTPVLLCLWMIPWLVVAEPLHFLIELPEHIGCDRKTRSVLWNTRSYPANIIWGYIANHNNYHIEHHLWPAVPAHRLKHLHRCVSDADGHCTAGFWHAIGEVRRAARYGPEAAAQMP